MLELEALATEFPDLDPSVIQDVLLNPAWEACSESERKKNVMEQLMMLTSVRRSSHTFICVMLLRCPEIIFLQDGWPGIAVELELEGRNKFVIYAECKSFYLDLFTGFEN